MENIKIKHDSHKKGMLKGLVLAGTLAGVALGAGAANADTVTVTVQQGDTLSGIANQHHTTVDRLQALNHLANINLIFPGEQIIVSGNQSTVQPTTPAKVASVVTPKAQQTTAVVTPKVQQAAPVKVAPAVTPKVQQATPAKITSTPKVQQTTYTKTTPTVTSNVHQTNTIQSQSNAPAVQTTTPTQTMSESEAAARAWIVARESGGNYNARNGQYIGRYQLTASYLDGNYSRANQDRVAKHYVHTRYGSWVNAQRFWENHGWY